MKGITLNAKMQILLDPLLLVDSRMLMQANSGGGKSMLARLIIEQSAAPRTEMGTTLDGETVRNYPEPRKIFHPAFSHGMIV